MKNIRDAIGFKFILNQSEWKIVSIHGDFPYEWAWIVNVKNPKNQARLSLKAIFQ